MKTETPLVLAPQDVIAEMRCESSAWAESFYHRVSKKSLREIADEVEYDKGNLSRFLDEQIGIPKNRSALLMRAFGNALPYQYVGWQMGFSVLRTDELRALKSELERLRGCEVENPAWHNWASPTPN